MQMSVVQIVPRFFVRMLFPVGNVDFAVSINICRVFPTHDVFIGIIYMLHASHRC